MADVPTPPGAKKELSMELRLLIALVLMLAVLFGTPYIYKALNLTPPAPAPQAPAKKTEPPKPDPAKSAAPPAAPKPAAKASAAKPPVTPSNVAAAAEQTIEIQTDLYRIVFSNRGAVVRSWRLNRYKDSQQAEALELVNPEAAPKTGWPLSVVSKDQDLANRINNALFVAKRTPDGLGVDFDYSDGRVTARKQFLFSRDSYLAQVQTEITENGVVLPHHVSWRGGFGDLGIHNPQAAQHVVHFNATDSKLVVQEAKAAKDGPVTAAGAFEFAGVEDTYFAAVFLPRGSGSVEVQTFSDKVITAFTKEEADYVGASIGSGDGRNRFAMFTGPKDLDTLKKVDPRLEQMVDWGWLGFLAKPLFLMVHWLDEAYVHSYGWSIIVCTIFINMALLPLKLSSMKSMKKMQSVQPYVQLINDKYKGVSMKDPRRQQQNQEVMELYQKHGINPLSSGCVPLLLQMPLLFAFYKVFTIAIEMRGASWLWVRDLSQPEHLAIRILPIAMIASQFLLQKMTPTAGGDPTQQKIMQFMPLMFGFMFYGVSSGLMLYWMTGNLIAIGQQVFFNKTATSADIAPPPQAQKRAGKK